MSEMTPAPAIHVPPAVRPGPGPRVEELVNAPTPWQAATRLADLPHLLFLDSADPANGMGRYSFVSADPLPWRSARIGGPREPTFSEVASLIEPYRCEPVGVPFPGGVAGLFGYGLAHSIERLPPSRVDEFELPDLAVGVYDTVLGWDHRTGRAWVVGHCEARMASFRSRLARPAPEPRRTFTSSVVPTIAHPGPRRGILSSLTREAFEAAVARAVEYIHAGDCFQVNLAQRLLTTFRGRPMQLYDRLRTRNPAPFSGFLDLGPYAVLSASPERFLHVGAGGLVTTRPIKGTRPRGSIPEADAAALSELISSDKDRAENVMIVDLLRNDLGKVCEYGSIAVDKVCEPESFRTVHHLTSQVSGRLRAGRSTVDLLQACFPGGSITGAPKVRAMEIIAELEPVARGPYCGSLAWLGMDGTMDSSILIRTMIAGRGWVQFSVGAGIVADSDPAREYEETLTKAAGMLAAL